MKLPSNFRYTKEHEWFRQDDNEGVVGITDFAQNELGDIVFVEIETLGETLEAGAVFGTVEAVKTVSDLYMPVAGTIIAVNDNLEENPAAVNTDPYGEGWMIRIAPTDNTQIDSLLDADAYQLMLES
ncbi:MAG: glycine cleavage system protein GcvH [Bacteroidales bacterium]|jgi:glycine cleavage system H protein|nr:glycine cleavage system protein GcvH [Bacteroidales bacterium]